jgi:hypothetical protein
MWLESQMFKQIQTSVKEVLMGHGKATSKARVEGRAPGLRMGSHRQPSGEDLG